MNRKTSLIIVLVVLALTSLACGITLTLPDDAIEIGDLRTDTIFIPAPEDSDTTSVKLEFGAGKLILKPGAPEGLIAGSASYNVDGLNPEVTISSSEVSIKQEPYKFKLGGLPNVNQVENTWELSFGTQPIELELRAGAFDGDFELGGMALEKLNVFSGASSVEAHFSTPNLSSMSELHFTTGASSAKLYELANANFSLMKFEGGAGDYTLDFSGTLQRDATVEIDAALSNVKIIVPDGTPTTLRLESNLTNVNAHGTWAGGASNYSLAGSGSTLTIVVKLGAGNLDLSN
ncbi:MAG: toast rack family protein [Anaerolineales bacterium]